MRIPAKLLENILKGILIKNHFSSHNASTIAEVLIEGSLRGYSHHGIERIFQILEGVEKKTINPKAHPQILKETEAMAVIDGQFGAGHPIAEKAMILALKKAKKLGIGACGVINSGHIGILSYYSEMASQQGCLGLVMSASSPIAVIGGGRVKTFGTNPISYSFPTTSSIPITADFSTSKISRATLKTYQKQKKDLPLGVAVDCEGKITKDPNEAFQGGLNTIDGGLKGSMISMLISVLAGHLLGGVINPDVTGSVNLDEVSNKGDFFLALDVNIFSCLEDFQEKSDLLAKFIHDQEVSFRMPGKQAHKNREKALAHGIEVSQNIFELFSNYGVTL